MTQTLNDIVMGIVQADLHERFGPGWSIEVTEHPERTGVVQIRIRRGEIDTYGSIAANANILVNSLSEMVEGKSIQEQVYEAIGDDWHPPYYLSPIGVNTCKHVHEEVASNLDQFAWTEQNNPE